MRFDYFKTVAMSPIALAMLGIYQEILTDNNSCILGCWGLCMVDQCKPREEKQHQAAFINFSTRKYRYIRFHL